MPFIKGVFHPCIDIGQYVTVQNGDWSARGVVKDIYLEGGEVKVDVAVNVTRQRQVNETFPVDWVRRAVG